VSHLRDPVGGFSFVGLNPWNCNNFQCEIAFSTSLCMNLWLCNPPRTKASSFQKACRSLYRRRFKNIEDAPLAAYQIFKNCGKRLY
jgi:hypothetical protein